MSKFEQDTDTMQNGQKPDIAGSLVRVARESGRTPFSIAFDFLKLRRQRGKLKLSEYLLYELYDTKKWTDDARDSFISAYRHWPVVNACNDPHWWAVTENKWLSSVFLKQNGIPIPESKAIFDVGVQLYPDAPKLQNSDDLKSFLTECKDYPLFAKPIGGMWSAGAFRITGHTDTHVLVDGSEPVTFAELVEGTLAKTPYIVQSCLKPHSFFEGITDATATVRCLNLIHNGTFKGLHTVLKIPQKGNVADNFWRSGNVLCNLDPETGEIKSIVTSKGGRRIVHDALPDNARTLLGEHLPCWSELRALNEQVALLHAANRYGSTDIALTENGPVVIEVNNGCAFELIQMATGEGLLTGEMTQFFQDCGAKL